jgi:hypothetical protein
MIHGKGDLTLLNNQHDTPVTTPLHNSPRTARLAGKVRVPLQRTGVM